MRTVAHELSFRRGRGREGNIKIAGRLRFHTGGFGAVDTTQDAPHNPARTWHPRDATSESGGASRAAKGADWKSAGLRLRTFESYLTHHPEASERTTEDGIRQKTSALCRLFAVLRIRV